MCGSQVFSNPITINNRRESIQVPYASSKMSLLSMVYLLQHPQSIGGGRGGGLGVLEHPQLSRSRYFNRAVTLIQQSVQNSYSLLIAQYSKIILFFWPQIPPNSISWQYLPGGPHAPPSPLDKESPLK